MSYLPLNKEHFDPVNTEFETVSVSAANSQEISIYFDKYFFGHNKYFLAYFWEENKYILAWVLFIEKVKEKSFKKLSPKI